MKLFIINSNVIGLLTWGVQMGNSIIHDKIKSLPPLKIKKTKHLKDLEKDIKIKTLINSRLLLDPEFNELYTNLNGKSIELYSCFDILDGTKDFTPENLITTFYPMESKVYKNYFNLVLNTISTKKIIEKMAQDLVNLEKKENIIKKEIQAFEATSESSPRIKERLKSLKKQLDFFKGEIEERNDKLEKMRVSEEKSNAELHEAIKSIYKGIYADMESLSDEIQNEITHFDKEKNYIKILSNTTLFYCSKCDRPLSFKKFYINSCKCGEEITDVSQTKKIIFYHFNKNLINFIKNNQWLEYGVDHLLKRKDFQTLVGYHVLGHSGAEHEIDNIAESKKTRFFCECKNKSKLTPNDIFVFSGKLLDVGCTKGYIFTTAKETNIELKTKNLAKSRNIDIITDVLEKQDEKILGEIQESN